jgi:hypothetical protein
LEVTTKPFLVAAPTGAILNSWFLEGRKFDLAYLLNQIEFTTYRSLSQALDRGHYYKLYLLDEYRIKDSHEPSLNAHVARKQSTLDWGFTRLGMETNAK